MTKDQAAFDKALAVGRPPNIVRLFPNSKALRVSGKAIDRAMRAKGQAMTIAANCRNGFVLRGALLAANRPTRRSSSKSPARNPTTATCPCGIWPAGPTRP